MSNCLEKIIFKILRAAELIQQCMSVNEIIEHIENLRLNSNIMVAVEVIQYMQRSGRLINLKANVIKSFNLKPIISLDENGFHVAYCLPSSYTTMETSGTKYWHYFLARNLHKSFWIML
jgi:fatty acid-binding protein DegV